MRSALRIIITLSAFILAAAHCTATPDPDPLEDTDRCSAACTRLQELECAEGADLEGPGGEVQTCLSFCTSTQEMGHAINPSCLETIQSCDEVSSKCGQ